MWRVCAIVIAAGSVAWADDIVVTPLPGTPVVTAPATDGTFQGVTRIIDRSLVLEVGAIEIDLEPAFEHSRLDNSEFAVVTGANAAVGVIDRVQIGASYAFEAIHETPSKSPHGRGILDVHASASLVHRRDLDVAVGPSLVVDFASEYVVPMDLYNVMRRTDVGIALGASVRYRFAKNAAVFTGTPLSGRSAGSQIFIGMNHDKAFSMTLPVGIEAQLGARTALFLSTSLFRYVHTDSSSASQLGIVDYRPFVIGFLFTIGNHVDAGLALDFVDTNVQAQNFQFGGTLRVHL